MVYLGLMEPTAATGRIVINPRQRWLVVLGEWNLPKIDAKARGRQIPKRETPAWAAHTIRLEGW